jgi:hypothetical protein
MKTAKRTAITVAASGALALSGLFLAAPAYAASYPPGTVRMVDIASTVSEDSESEGSQDATPEPMMTTQMNPDELDHTGSDGGGSIDLAPLGWLTLVMGISGVGLVVGILLYVRMLPRAFPSRQSKDVDETDSE